MLGDAADRSSQGTEANRTVHQRKQDLQFPLAAEGVDGALEVAEQGRIWAAIAIVVAAAGQVFHTGLEIHSTCPLGDSDQMRP